MDKGDSINYHPFTFLKLNIMCKYFIGNHNMQVKVTTEDITVFKAVYLDLANNKWKGICRTDYEAPLNTEVTAIGNYPDLATQYFCEIGSGMFHSCADLNSLQNRIGFADNFYIVKAIIPKGAKYLISKVPNDICSDRLIVTDVIIAGNGVSSPSIDYRRLRKAEVSTYSKNNRTYIHIKDKNHEVYLSLKNLGQYNWDTAMEQCKNLGEALPSTDDWDLINKYRHQIDPLIEGLHGDQLDKGFWSSSEYDHNTVWCYSGGYSNFYSSRKDFLSYMCRPVLVL